MKYSAPCAHGEIEGSVSLEQAAEFSGIDAKRLRGRVYRNSVRLNDPIGCPVCGRVMLWSVTAAQRSDANLK